MLTVKVTLDNEELSSSVPWLDCLERRGADDEVVGAVAAYVLNTPLVCVTGASNGSRGSMKVVVRVEWSMKNDCNNTF